jgi:hypothetical protein
MAGMDCERHYGILDVERELIAAILADNRAYKAVSHLLRPEHFLAPAHQRLFAQIAEAVGRGAPAEFDLPQPGGHPLITWPAIDPLDHALMVYGSFLGRAAVMAPTGRSSLPRAIALDGIGSN